MSKDCLAPSRSLYVYWNPSIALSYFLSLSLSLFFLRFFLCLCRSLDFYCYGVVVLRLCTLPLEFSCVDVVVSVDIYKLLWLAWFTLVLIVAHNRKGKHASLWQCLDFRKLPLTFTSFTQTTMHLFYYFPPYFSLLGFFSPRKNNEQDENRKSSNSTLVKLLSILSFCLPLRKKKPVQTNVNQMVEKLIDFQCKMPKNRRKLMEKFAK